jgi:hypothetical protein
MQNLQEMNDVSAAQRLLQQALEAAARQLPAGSQQLLEREIGEPLHAMLAGLQLQPAQQVKGGQAAEAEAQGQQQNAAQDRFQNPGTAPAEPPAATISNTAPAAALADPTAAAAAAAAAALAPAGPLSTTTSMPAAAPAGALHQAANGVLAELPAVAAPVDVAELGRLLRHGSEEDKIRAACELGKLDWNSCSLSGQVAAVPAVVEGLAQMQGSSSHAAQLATAW